MRRRKLLWHLFPSYLLITVIAVAAVSVYSYVALSRFYHDETRDALTARASLLEERMRPMLVAGDAAGLDATSGALGPSVSTRITVVSPTGIVLADSDEDRSVMEIMPTGRRSPAPWPVWSERHSATATRSSAT